MSQQWQEVIKKSPHSLLEIEYSNWVLFPAAQTIPGLTNAVWTSPSWVGCRQTEGNLEEWLG